LIIHAQKKGFLKGKPRNIYKVTFNSNNVAKNLFLYEKIFKLINMCKT